MYILIHARNAQLHNPLAQPARNRQLDSAADTLEHTDYSVCRAEAAQASGIKDFKNMRYCYSKHVTCVCTL